MTNDESHDQAESCSKSLTDTSHREEGEGCCGEAEELGEADVSGEDEEFADGCSEEESGDVCG